MPFAVITPLGFRILSIKRW